MAEPAAAAAGPGEAEHLRQITQIPLFYGRPDKDSLTAGMLIKRVDAAAEAAGWNNQRKLSAFFLVLRDKALIWHKTLKADRINLRDWSSSMIMSRSSRPGRTAQTSENSLSGQERCH